MKKLVTLLFPVMLTLVCAVGVWGNEQNAAQPCCNKSAQVAQNAPKVAGCDKCAKTEKAVTANQGCGNCAKKAEAQQGKDCPCPNCAKKADAEQAQGCANCAKRQVAEAKPCAGGCAGCAEAKLPGKIKQDENKPCCNKAKP